MSPAVRGPVVAWSSKTVQPYHLPKGTRTRQSPLSQRLTSFGKEIIATKRVPFGRARFFSAERNHRPVNARRREIGCRAVFVLAPLAAPNPRGLRAVGAEPTPVNPNGARQRGSREFWPRTGRRGDDGAVRSSRATGRDGQPETTDNDRSRCQNWR
jgi:hypothetical protein